MATTTKNLRQLNKSTADSIPAYKFHLRKHFAAIEAAYRDGNRDPEIVCTHVARKASKAVVNGSYHYAFSLEILSVGYAAALKAWNEYDPAKDKGNGIEAFLLKRAEGHMKNAAAEMTHRMNLRCHNKDEVLPTVFGYLDYKDDGLGPNGATKRADSSSAYEETGFSPRTSKPEGPSDKWVDKQARNAAEICLYNEIEKLPSKEEQEFVMDMFGVFDRRKETVKTMALRLNKSESTVERKLAILLDDIRTSATRENPVTAALPKIYGLHLKDGIAQRATKAPPLFRNGAKVTRQSCNKKEWDAWNVILKRQ